MSASSAQLPEIGTWGTGVNLVNTSGELWEGTVTFAAAAIPTSSTSSRTTAAPTGRASAIASSTLPTDGTTSVVLDTQSWNNLPMGCGMETVLTEDKVVCIQLCLNDAVTDGGCA